MMPGPEGAPPGPTKPADGAQPAGEAALPLVVVRRGPLPAGPRRARRGLRGLGAAAVAAALLLGGFALGRRPRPPEAAATAPPRRPDGVVGLGKIEPATGVVIVAPPFGAGDARIAELRVAEGDAVEAGAILAVLDNEPALRAAIDVAKAQVDARAATQAQVVAAVVSSRAELDAQAGRAEIAAAQAAREVERLEALGDAVPQQPLDQQRALRDEAKSEVERVRAARGRFGEGHALAQADAVVAGKNLAAAKSELARATADLEKAYVRAPFAGTVLTVFARPGERPGAAGVLSMGDLDQMQASVEVHEDHAGRVALGDPVEITATSLAEPLHGQVARIGLEVRRQQGVDPSPAANTDARVVEVLVALDASSRATARRRSNLQVVARFAKASAP